MPIFKFLAVTAPLLVALLFAANAMQAPRGPLFTNNSEGLPRSEPIRAQTKAPERSRVLARVEPPRTVAPTVTAAPPLAQAPVPPVAKTAIATPAAPEAVAATAPELVTYPALPAPTTPEAVTASAPVVPETVATSTPVAPEAATTADVPAKRKHAARKHDRNGDTAYRDGPYARDHRGPAENGYPYGVRPGEARAERRDWQRRQWSGGDFGQNRWRF